MDKIRIEILPDGSLRVLTEGVSAANHVSADDLLSTLTALMGGKRETEERIAHGHHHTDADQHHHH